MLLFVFCRYFSFSIGRVLIKFFSVFAKFVTSSRKHFQTPITPIFWITSILLLARSMRRPKTGRCFSSKSPKVLAKTVLLEDIFWNCVKLFKKSLLYHSKGFVRVRVLSHVQKNCCFWSHKPQILNFFGTRTFPPSKKTANFGYNLISFADYRGRFC